MFFLLVGVNFSGCEKDPRTMEYFTNNIEIAKKRVDECQKMERMSENTIKDCNNAKIAVKNAVAKSEIEISKAIMNLQMIISDFNAFYTAFGKLDKEVGKMTNVSNPIKIDDSVCVNFTIKSEKEIEVNINENDEICKDVIKNRKFVRPKELYLINVIAI